MKLKINGQTTPELQFREGRYFYTFTPQTDTDSISISSDCLGDTDLNKIQIEKGSEMTPFEIPKVFQEPLSGIFKDLKEINLELSNPESELWGNVRINAKGMLEEYHNGTLQAEFMRHAGGVETRLRDELTKTESQFSQTVNSLRSDVQDATGKMTTAIQTAEGYYSRAVDDVKGQFNEIKRIADGTSSRVGTVESNLGSRIDQLSTQIQSTVTDKISGLETTTTQLAGSWAVQNLTSAGSVLSELNVNSGGVKIKGKLINLDGTVTMDSAFAKKLMVDTFSTNDITAFMGKFGSIIANNLDVNNLSGNKATLLQALFRSANANISISGDGIESWRNNGERGMVLDSIGMKVLGTYNQTAGYFSYTKSTTQNNYSRDAIGINVKYKYDLMLGYEGSYVHSDDNLYHIGLHMDGRTGDIGIEQNLTIGGKLNGINVQSGAGRISLLTDAGSGIEINYGKLYVVYGGERKQIT